MLLELLKTLSTQSLATNIWVILTLYPQCLTANSEDDVILMMSDT